MNSIQEGTTASELSVRSDPKALVITAPTLLVKDIERSKEFYRDMVGLELFRTNEKFANFKMGDLILALWELDHVQESVAFEAITSAPEHHNSIMACLLESCAAVDAQYERLQRNGVVFLYPPKSFPWNVYATYFTDPDGFMWEIFAWQEGGPEAGGHAIHTEA